MAMFSKKNSGKGGKGKFAGIALHVDSVRYVEVEGGRGALKVVKQELVPLAKGGVVKDAVASLEAVSAAFESLKSLVGGFKCPVVLGIPSRDVILRLVEYPKMALSDIKESLQFEFDKYFPYPYNEAAADVSEVDVPGQDAADKSMVLVATCKQRMASDLMRTASRSGIELTAMEPMNVAFFRAMTGSQARAGSYFVVSAGVETTQIMLGYNDNGILFRSTATDLASLEAREADESIIPIVRDVQNTIIFAGNQYKGLTPNHVILGGLLDKDSKLGALLEENASVTVDSPDVWSLWDTQPVIAGAKGFEDAFGLALRNII